MRHRMMSFIARVQMVPETIVLGAIALLLLSGMAFAQDTSTQVTVNYGDLVAAILTNARDAVVALLLAVTAGLVAKLPAWVKAFVGTQSIEQLLTKAVDYGIATTIGATKDKALTVDVGNQVVAAALRYALDHGAKWVIDWAGDQKLIEQKIIARLNVIDDGALGSGVSRMPLRRN